MITLIVIFSIIGYITLGFLTSMAVFSILYKPTYEDNYQITGFAFVCWPLALVAGLLYLIFKYPVIILGNLWIAGVKKLNPKVRIR